MVEVEVADWPTWITNAHTTKAKKEKPGPFPPARRHQWK
jgi:hypothetical protein